MRADLRIALERAGDGTVTARGDLAATPYWCRWDGSTLWMVGSAATPVGDDDIALELCVGPDVHATVRSVAAMVVYAGRGMGTAVTTRLHVAEGAMLRWQPEPVIVTGRARHRSLLVADVAPGGRVLVDEIVVLGRTGEAPGAFTSTTDLRRDGATISLTSFDTSVPGWSGPGGTGGAKVIGTRLAVDPSPAGAAAVAGGPGVDASTVVLRPEAGGVLATSLARDPDQARAQLDAVLAGPPAGRAAVGSAAVTPPVRSVRAREELLPVGGG